MASIENTIMTTTLNIEEIASELQLRYKVRYHDGFYECGDSKGDGAKIKVAGRIAVCHAQFVGYAENIPGKWLVEIHDSAGNYVKRYATKDGRDKSTNYDLALVECIREALKAYDTLRAQEVDNKKKALNKSGQERDR